MRGTCDYPVYPGIANHVSWLDPGEPLDWVGLIIDGPLCLVIDTVLLPIDLIRLTFTKDEHPASTHSQAG